MLIIAFSRKVFKLMESLQKAEFEPKYLSLDFLKIRDRFLTLINCVLQLLFFGEGNVTPLQYSCLENPTDGGASQAAVHGVVESRTQLRDFAFTFHFHALEREMATHSSVLAWRIPGTGEPGGLPSMGSRRVGHDRSDLAAAGEIILMHSDISQVQSK